MNKHSYSQGMSSVNDLKLAKKVFRNEVKLYEQALVIEAVRLGGTLQQSVRNSVRSFTRKILYLSLIRIMKRKRNKIQ